ncbi:aspartate dehydrogenase [Sporolactobacillus sp. THM7-7]|nr:aspartate dehydrogenase [Sporolactobacillus sp. THM7-7]
MKSVGLIGYGAIGKDVVKYINENKAGNVQLKGILVRNKEKYEYLTDLKDKIYDDADVFFQLGLDIVVEHAGHGAVYQYAIKALSSGSDFMIVSVGALADEAFLQRVMETAKKYKRKLILPSAAIGGLDRLSAAMFNSIEEVRLETRKPPKAWRGTIAEDKVTLDRVTEPVCIYKGNARESAKLFPESTNVAATLSLSGVGFEKTQVHVYVDPYIKQNRHKIYAKGYFGEIEIDVKNIPSLENPKSGYIVAMSVCKVLKNMTATMVVGI